MQAKNTRNSLSASIKASQLNSPTQYGAADTQDTILVQGI